MERMKKNARISARAIVLMLVLAVLFGIVAGACAQRASQAANAIGEDEPGSSPIATIAADMNPTGNHGVCVGWASIILGLIVLAGFICVALLVKFRFPNIRKTFLSVGLMTSGASILASIIIVTVHPCIVSAFGFGICVVDALLLIIYGDGKEEKPEPTTVEASISPETAPEEEKGLTLKESFAKAVIGDVQTEIDDKKAIGRYLQEKYEEGVVINHRGPKTPTGLPLADTHYVVRQNGKECFIYVYDVDGVVMLLAQLEDSYAEELIKKHERVYKSAFPRSKKSWYTVVVDDTFSKADVEAILDASYEHVKG